MNVINNVKLSKNQLKDNIRNSETFKEKTHHFISLSLKALITIVFSIVFISIFTFFFHKENSVAGVAVLLSLFTFKHVHFGCNLKHSFLTILTIFSILAFGPHLANMVGIHYEWIINFISLLSILILSCYHIEFYNHAIFILSYLILYGSDVSGSLYLQRVLGLLVGSVFVSICLYKNHRDKNLEKSIFEIVKEFDLNNFESIWKFKLALLVSFSMYMGALVGLKKTMWIGIATMSILTPFIEQRKEKMINRLIGTVLGCLLFYILISFLPDHMYGLLGIIGGICVGFSTTYRYQTIFNALGALGLAMTIYGTKSTMLIRILDNLFAIIFVLITSMIFDLIYSYFKNSSNKSTNLFKLVGIFKI